MLNALINTAVYVTKPNNTKPEGIPKPIAKTIMGKKITGDANIINLFLDSIVLFLLFSYCLIILLYLVY